LNGIVLPLKGWQILVASQNELFLSHRNPINGIFGIHRRWMIRS
jgi:hypothetical protein